jgi:hypothetical protein
VQPAQPVVICSYHLGRWRSRGQCLVTTIVPVPGFSSGCFSGLYVCRVHSMYNVKRTKLHATKLCVAADQVATVALPAEQCCSYLTFFSGKQLACLHVKQPRTGACYSPTIGTTTAPRAPSEQAKANTNVTNGSICNTLSIIHRPSLT